MKTFQAYLPEGGRTYSCVHCRAHLANHDELISKVYLTSKSNISLPHPSQTSVKEEVTVYCIQNVMGKLYFIFSHFKGAKEKRIFLIPCKLCFMHLFFLYLH